MRELLKSLKSLSDETRVRILGLLLVRECCVCEVMQALNISQTRASRNLNILYDAGLLTLRKEGLWSLYSINEDVPDYLAGMMDAVRQAITANPGVIRDRERLASSERVGPECVRCQKT